MYEKYTRSYWRICPVCGKEFYVAPENVYKLIIDNKTVHYCKWTCYRKAQQAQERKRVGRKHIAWR